MPETFVSHYRILAPLGAGGMGVVHLAEDQRLKRKVALKFIKPSIAGDNTARARLLREAQAASALDHPNIATVYEIGEAGGQLFIAMGYYPGETLKSRIDRGPLSIDEFAGILGQIARGLAAAHEAGIVHRDLKPPNIIIAPSRQVKILDFGLAKVAAAPSAETAAEVTEAGTTLGTTSYMSPEQARGEHVDQRADVWALGVVMFEVLTGRRPFEGDTVAAVLSSILTEKPKSLRSLRSDVPVEYERLVEKALVKDPAERTLTAAEAEDAIARHLARTAARPRSRLGAMLRRPAMAIPLAVACVGLAGIAAVGGRRAAGRWRASYTMLPEISRRADREEFAAAVDLALQAERDLPGDPGLARLWPTIARPVPIRSEPPGADVSYTVYGQPEMWHPLGRTPLDARLPRGWLRVKAEKQGLETVEDLTGPGPGAAVPSFALMPIDKAPAGMVRAIAPAAPFSIYVFGLETPRVRVSSFWIDRYEVTNRQFKAFVDGGGYRRHEFWQQPFKKDGRTIDWSDAMDAFRDATGRPGPAMWELGTYAAGQDNLPVTGVSWYEAAAYAAFTGKSLPTVFHWSLVASQALTGFVIPLATFAARAPVAVGTTRALHRFGAYDLAGNVKEWCANEGDGGSRYLLGGGWDEPPYMFRDADARSPFTRAANAGFRTVKYDEGDASVAPVSRVVLRPSRTYAAEKPVGDDVFNAYRRVYSYDRTDVKARIASTDDASPDWRMEKITFAAAYGQEQMIAYVFLPKAAKPPYQTLVYMPNGGAWDQRSSAGVIASPPFGFLAKAGRAVVFPIFKGTYERGTDAYGGDEPKSTDLWRDYIIAFSKDLGRTLDYLSTRPDIDQTRIGYFGVSRGAALSPMLLAAESRIKTAVLWIPGLYLEKQAPEVDGINFAPRVKMPVLQLSGRYDYNFPDETSSLPFFNALGTPTEQKRRVMYDTGHNLPTNEAVKETLDWLDRYLGPIR